MMAIYLAHASGTDWTSLGKALRASAMDAHEGRLPELDLAYGFLLDNPECFTGAEEWPAGMPTVPPLDLAVAYFGGVN